MEVGGTAGVGGEWDIIAVVERGRWWRRRPHPAGRVCLFVEGAAVNNCSTSAGTPERRYGHSAISGILAAVPLLGGPDACC